LTFRARLVRIGLETRCSEVVMESVETLEKTTFSGRRFTRKQLEEIQNTVRIFKNLSRKELAQTLCEHLDWASPNGALKIHSCYALLEELEKHGIVELPAKRQTKARVRKAVSIENPEQDHPISDTLSAISPIELQLVTSPQDRNNWKAHLQKYHYLGYRHAFGAHLCYFIVSRAVGQKIGCLLFSASAAWTLAPRDEWIGWEKKHRQKLLHLILSNDRFLIFPWVNVPNLASAALSLATKQIGDDWLRVYGYRPVLIETFVDTTKYTGACYKAANWQYLGQTKGRGHYDPHHLNLETVKDIYVYTLESDWKHVLTSCQRVSLLKKKYRNDVQSSHKRSVDETFVSLWENAVKIIGDVASQYDKKWQIRKRLIDSMLIILLIFRLVCSKNSQSYGSTIDELWDSCERLKLPLPQKSSIAPSSFCAARRKLDESVFKVINQRIIEAYEQNDSESYRWLGHRIFAVDGSRINLPPSLLASGYKLPTEVASYPQGLVSCLYQLKSKMPYDFDFVAHTDERACAERHLSVLKKDDVVIYDRGYFSYPLLHLHCQKGIHAIFRLQINSYTVIRNFFESQQNDLIATISPVKITRREIMRDRPDLDIAPLELRLIKYRLGDDVFCLGTTLVDRSRYGNILDFMNVYHERWGVEELYKISKRVFSIEDFHAQNERGIKQEIFAHFALVTMNRIFTNQADDDLNLSGNPSSEASDQIDSEFEPTKICLNIIKTNFKNCIHVFTRSIEELFLAHGKIKTDVERAFRFILGRHQKDRPGRCYARKSMRPEIKWRPRNRPIKKRQMIQTPEIAAST
jgi:hypothetical protein